MVVRSVSCLFYFYLNVSSLSRYSYCFRIIACLLLKYVDQRIIDFFLFIQLFLFLLFVPFYFIHLAMYKLFSYVDNNNIIEFICFRTTTTTTSSKIGFSFFFLQSVLNSNLYAYMYRSFIYLSCLSFTLSTSK